MTCASEFNFIVTDTSGQLNAMLRPAGSPENLALINNVHCLVALWSVAHITSRVQTWTV